MPRITILRTKRSQSIVNALYSARVIQSYIAFSKKGTKYISFSSYHYKNVTYFSHLKIVSTPSKSQTISLRALKIVNKSLGNSIILLETDRGIISHTEALSTGIGGRIMAVIS